MNNYPTRHSGAYRTGTSPLLDEKTVQEHSAEFEDTLAVVKSTLQQKSPRTGAGFNDSNTIDLSFFDGNSEAAIRNNSAFRRRLRANSTRQSDAPVQTGDYVKSTLDRRSDGRETELENSSDIDMVA